MRATASVVSAAVDEGRDRQAMCERARAILRTSALDGRLRQESIKEAGA